MAVTWDNVIAIEYYILFHFIFVLKKSALNDNNHVYLFPVSGQIRRLEQYLGVN